MKVCFFGTYIANYSRTSSLRLGFVRNGVEVVEVHNHTPIVQMEVSNDFTVGKSIQRVWRKLSAYIYLLSQSSKVLSCDYIFVLHPGHLDLPLAWILKNIGRKKLIFDESISPYDMMFVGRNIADRKSLKAKIVKLVEGTLLHLPDKIFVDTRNMKDFIVKEFRINKEKIFIIPVGSNDSLYRPGEKKQSNKKTSVIFFGMYNPTHGMDFIMNAIKLLKDEDIIFTLYGDGYLKNSLVSFAQNNQLKNVDFVGLMPEPDLVKNLQNGDILLGVFSNSPIFQKVIPNKVYAALACKKPLISAQLPPMEEYFIHRENIYFCKREDAKDLALAIKTLTSDKKLQEKLASNGYATYINNFTPKKIGEILLKEIKSA